jgi:DNA-binding HxlR family transcriptional regulator
MSRLLDEYKERFVKQMLANYHGHEVEVVAKEQVDRFAKMLLKDAKVMDFDKFIEWMTGEKVDDAMLSQLLKTLVRWGLIDESHRPTKFSNKLKVFGKGSKLRITKVGQMVYTVLHFDDLNKVREDANKFMESGLEEVEDA